MAEFQEISDMISDIQRERADGAASRDWNGAGPRPARRPATNAISDWNASSAARKAARSAPAGELHGPYWYLYRPKEKGPGRTSEYVGKVLPQRLAEEFDIPEDQRTPT